MMARRIVIAGSAVAFMVFLCMIQIALAMFGMNHSIVIFGFDIMNTAFFVTYLMCAFVFLWGAVGPLPRERRWFV